MDEQRSVFDRFSSPEGVRGAGAAALVVLALFLFVATMYVFQSYRYIGSGVAASNTITISGEGEVFAVPDIATFSVSVQERADEVEPAQSAAAEKSNAIIAYLREQGIEERDIRTTGYDVYPRYEWREESCPIGVRCPGGTQVLLGYEVSQTITVKVRDTEQAGAILSGVGSRGASNVSGLSFTIDDEDALNAEARAQAIEDARDKANELARQLNVRIVRIVGFHEDGAYKAYPAYGRAMEAGDMMVQSSAPQLPMGENTIYSNVTVTYEIR